MNVIKSENIIFCDVDDTLVQMLDYENLELDTGSISILDPYDSLYTSRMPMHKNIRILKTWHARGAYVVVWSAFGYQWAETVVKALCLQDHVHQIMSKPRAHIDDLPSTQWMGERIWFPD